MYTLPVAMSLTATFMSALTLLGAPAEMYIYATMFWWICLAFIIAIAISSQIFIPFFYKLKLTSMFEVSLNERICCTTRIKQRKCMNVVLYHSHT